MSGSVETSCAIRPIGKIGERSSGPAGSPVAGLSGGGGGLPGRSASRLIQLVGIPSSRSWKLTVSSTAAAILCLGTAPNICAGTAGSETGGKAALLVEPRFQRLQLAPNLVREPAAELRQVRLDLVQLLADLIRIDLEQRPHVLVGDLEALGVDIARGRHQPDRRLGGLAMPLA